MWALWKGVDELDRLELPLASFTHPRLAVAEQRTESFVQLLREAVFLPGFEETSEWGQHSQHFLFKEALILLADLNLFHTERWYLNLFNVFFSVISSPVTQIVKINDYRGSQRGILATVQPHREDPLWAPCTKFPGNGSSVCLIFQAITNER